MSQLSSKLEYAELTSETSHPYKQWKEKSHSAEVSKYHNVRDCLIETERTAESPDLRLIDWNNITTIPALEVCTWRIFTSLKDHQDIFAWLEFHQLVLGGRAKENDGRPPTSIGSVSELPKSESLDGTKIYVGYFNWFKELPFPDEDPLNFSSSLSLNINFDQLDGEVVFVNIIWAPIL